MPRKPPGPALLRSWRESQDWTQTELGERLGVSQSRVSDWESAKAPPDLPHAVGIERLTKGAVPCGAWVDTEREPSRGRRSSATPGAAKRLTVPGKWSRPAK